MKPNYSSAAASVNTASSASQTASSKTNSTSVKYELLSFRAAQPPSPIRFEFGPNKDTFTLDLPTDANDGTTRQQIWREWKRQAIEHAVVRAAFKPNAVLHFSEFALRLPGGASGEWIGPESLKDDQEAETKLLLRIAGASTTTTSILLLYAPRIHLCTFDGIKFSASSFGHWLTASDTKTYDRLRKLEVPDDSSRPNDWLLKDKHSSDLSRLLFRIALFMHEDLGLGPESYVISVPFGEYVFADGDVVGKEEVRARVQVTDARIFWTLLLKFEDKLVNDESDRDRRLDYFVHQRQAWIDARSSDYRRWAAQEAAAVRHALDTLTPPHHHTNAPFKLPKNCSWDEYGRMQLCLKMLSPIQDMVGQMGSISVKLKNVVAAVQMVSQLTGTTVPNAPVSINVSARADLCHVLLPADRYMNVLTRASADPKAWGNALLDALRDAPDRLYSGLLNETSGLYQCSREDLAKIDDCLKALAPRLPGQKGIAKMVDTSALPVTADVLRSLESKNHTDKRLFLERALEMKAAAGPVLVPLGPAVSERAAQIAQQQHKPTIWEKKRAAAAPPSQQQQYSPAPQPPAPLIAPSIQPDREDVVRHQNEDFARFEGPDPSKMQQQSMSKASPPSVVSSGGVPTVKAVLQRPQQHQSNVASSAVPTAVERPPPPTVVPPPQPRQQGPPRAVPQVVQPASTDVKSSRAGPPTVLAAAGGSKPLPPQVIPGRSANPAPVVVAPAPVDGTKPQQQGANNRRQGGGNTNFQQRRERQTKESDDTGGDNWRVHSPRQVEAPQQVIPAQPPPAPMLKEPIVNVKDVQVVDREDRGYEMTSSGSSGNNRGRRGGGARGGGQRGGGGNNRGQYNNRNPQYQHPVSNGQANPAE